MSSPAQRWLDRFGLLGAARRIRHRLAPDSELIRVPSYEPAIARLVRASGDPVRYASLALAIRTLQRDQVAGDLAEVGVYRKYPFHGRETIIRFSPVTLAYEKHTVPTAT